MTDIHLREHDSAFVEEQVKAGVYEDADAVVHAGLRLLKSKEGQRAELRRLIQEGMDDVENGKVYAYESAEALLDDLKKMGSDN